MSDRVELAARQLARRLGDCKVSTSLLDRVAYSTDASLYQIVPRAVVRAESIADVIELFAWSKRERIPLTFRAAGTSLSGQSVTEHVLVALRGFNDLAIPPTGEWVRAGCMLRGGYVNGRLRRFHRRIGPDPASIDACTIGGIIANNASGMCCGISQNAYHTLRSMTLVLPSGTVLDTTNLAAADQRLAELEPALYAGLAALRDRVRQDQKLCQLIRHRTRLKNTMGYAIAAFLDFDRPADILQHLMVGSEGTLGFIVDATLTTIDEPPFATTALLGYRSVHDACHAVAAFDGEGAVAIELMDDATLNAIAHHAQERHQIQLPRHAALLVEFRYNDPDNAAVMKSLVERLARQSAAVELTIASDDQRRNLLWRLRKGAMPSVGAARAISTALINEDVAFPRDRLSAAVGDLRSLLLASGFTDAVIFGHARDGNMHFAFSLPPDDVWIERYARFMDELAELVVARYDGSLKAEHSTGRNMAPYVEQQWGKQATELMWQLKSLVDPEHLLNPGVILSRDRTIHLQNIKQLPAVHPVLDRCIECGFCERVCPSSTLTLSPRQRIVIMRSIAHARQQRKTQHARMLEKMFRYAGDRTCATDGMCQVACPVGINTGDFIIELRAQRKSGCASWLANAAARHPAVWIGLIASALRLAQWVSRILGKRTLASLTATLARRFRTPAWLPTMGVPDVFPRSSSDSADMIYVPSCMACFGGRTPDGESVTNALLELAKRAGIAIAVIERAGTICCGHPWHSKGYRDAYLRALERWVTVAYEASNGGRLPIVTDSSSCALSLQAAHTVLSGEHADRFARLRILSPVETVEAMLPNIASRITREHRVVLHPTCAVVRSQQQHRLIALLQSCRCRVIVPQSSSCCGMAGDRGLHYPELPAAALHTTVREVAQLDADFFVSTNLPCQWQLSSATGRQYISLWCAIERMSR